uniref:Uncharacterized protein n=1 Tax=Aegilops tauschii subsp. strangulata TaxID=200361 RepID=A0A453C2Q0_AEGTS
QFLSNSLYVGGESYCGMIIPTLALEIHISNKESGEEPLLNLKFAMENCGGNYSDPPNVLCAESIQAIADVSFPKVTISYNTTI